MFVMSRAEFGKLPFAVGSDQWVQVRAKVGLRHLCDQRLGFARTSDMDFDALRAEGRSQQRFIGSGVVGEAARPETAAARTNSAMVNPPASEFLTWDFIDRGLVVIPGSVPNSCLGVVLFRIV